MDILKRKISANFAVSEFFIKEPPEHATEDRICRIRTKLVMPILQPLRDELGVPIIITSGYRNPEHNREVGGQPDSHHLMLEDKCAADITCADMPRAWALLKTYVRVFCYAYWQREKNFIHISGLTANDWLNRVGEMWVDDPEPAEREEE
jgi:hypothetical protein